MRDLRMLLEDIQLNFDNKKIFSKTAQIVTLIYLHHFLRFKASARTAWRKQKYIKKKRKKYKR